MFGVVQPTPYDVYLRIAGVPVRISVWFWLGATILGFGALKESLAHLLAWILAMFISILVHELGHALTARMFGLSPQIVLHHFGGYAMYPRNLGSDAEAKSILITLAGPLAGLMLFVIFLVISLLDLTQLPPNTPERVAGLVNNFVFHMLWINLIWSILNLVPVLPLDGGQICRDICLLISPAHGFWIAVRIGIAVAILAAVGCFSINLTFPAVLFAILGVQNFQMLQSRSQ